MILEKNKYKLVYSVKAEKIYKSGLIYNYSNYGDLKEEDLKKYLEGNGRFMKIIVSLMKLKKRFLGGFKQ